MVTDALDGRAAQHIDRIVEEVLASRDWDRAPLRLLAAADYAVVVEGGGRRG
jgi:hypothetical protein